MPFVSSLYNLEREKGAVTIGTYNIGENQDYVADVIKKINEQKHCGERLIRLNVEIGDDNFDELLLIEPILIAMEHPHAYIEVIFDDKSKKGEYHTIATYCLFISDLSNLFIKYKNSTNKRASDWWEKNSFPRSKSASDVWETVSSRLGRLSPLFFINKSSLEILRKKSEYSAKNIDSGVPNVSALREILRHGNPSEESLKQITALYEYVYERNIQKKIPQKDVSSKHLRECLERLHEAMFNMREMVEIIKGVPILARIIFIYFEFAHLTGSASALVGEICANGRKDIRLDHMEERYFLDAYGYLLTKEERDLVKKLESRGHSNQAMFSLDEQQEVTTLNQNGGTLMSTYHLHPFVSAAALDACIIADGLIQLIENIVEHAGEQQSDGQGLISIHLRNYKTDEELLQKRYGKSYFEKISTTKGTDALYYLEVIVSDLSKTTIMEKFRKHSDVPLELKEFFDPSEYGREFWKEYYSDAEIRTQHFGLQIFDSVVNSKKGLFGVVSGNEKHSRDQEFKKLLPVRGFGTTYTILLPLFDIPVFGAEMPDTMLSFNLTQVMTNVPSRVTHITFEDIKWDKDKGSVIRAIREKFPPEHTKQPMKKDSSAGPTLDEFYMKNDEVFVCAIEDNYVVEYLIKGALWFLFSKPSKTGGKTRLAFINCKESEFLEVLRLVVLYYGKHGYCDEMKNAEIYIRGESAGQEMVIFGQTLEDVRRTVIKVSALRGFSPNLTEAITKLLKKGDPE